MEPAQPNLTHQLIVRACAGLPIVDLANATEYLAVREWGLAVEAVACGLLSLEGSAVMPYAADIALLVMLMELGDRPFVAQIREKYGV